MRIALVSLDQTWLDKESNFAECERYTRQASDAGCNAVVFPEMTLTGFAPDVQSIIEPAAESQSMLQFAELAQRYRIDIVFGVCLQGAEEERPFNTLCIATSSGYVEPVYNKMHLFTYADEDRFLTAGDQIAIRNICGIRFGFAICYDLRFPELFSLLAKQSDALMVIANWPARRVDHWRTLLLARAIENQCSVVGVNRIGADGNGLQYEKSSFVVQPEGIVQSPDFSSEVLDIYEIDPEENCFYREQFPTVRDKRYELYGSLMASDVSL